MQMFNESRGRRALGVFLTLSVLIVVLLAVAEFLPRSDKSHMWLMLINVAAVLGLQFYSGNTGELSIGHVAFMALGAYGAAIFTVPPAIKKSMLRGIPDWLEMTQFDLVTATIIAVLLAMLVAWIFGFIVVRLGHEGVVIATFGLLIIVQAVIMGAKGWTNGVTSMYGVPRTVTGWHVGMVVIAAIAAASFFKESRWGLQTRAARDERLAAKSMGVRVLQLNHFSWVISAGICAAAGALLVHVLGAASPRNFYLVLTLEILAMFILGGQRSVSGAVFGAILVSMLIYVVRKFESGIDLGLFELPELFGATQLVLTAAILYILFKRPQGLFGLAEFSLLPKRPRSKPVSVDKIDLRDNGHKAVEDLSKHFGGLEALDGVSFEIRPGEILGLIGPNGAGKSTLINTVMGGFFATRGSIALHGKNATRWGAHRLAREGVGRTFQNIQLFHDLTVLENVMVPLAARSPKGTNLEAEALGWLERLKVAEHAERYPSELPYGDQRRVEIARALALHPTFLLFDEPAAGMNHDETNDLRHLLTEIRDQYGVGIVIIEHDMHMIINMCDRIVVLNRGRLISSGTPDEVRKDPVVIEAYIGNSDANTAQDVLA